MRGMRAAPLADRGSSIPEVTDPIAEWEGPCLHHHRCPPARFTIAQLHSMAAISHMDNGDSLQTTTTGLMVWRKARPGPMLAYNSLLTWPAAW